MRMRRILSSVRHAFRSKASRQSSSRQPLRIRKQKAGVQKSLSIRVFTTSSKRADSSNPSASRAGFFALLSLARSPLREIFRNLHVKQTQEVNFHGSDRHDHRHYS